FAVDVASANFQCNLLEARVQPEEPQMTEYTRPTHHWESDENFDRGIGTDANEQPVRRDAEQEASETRNINLHDMGANPHGLEDRPYIQGIAMNTGDTTRAEDEWRQQGPYTGIGPQGFQRSDMRIMEDVCERLAAHGWLDASAIEVN